MWLESIKFKPEYLPETNINSLIGDSTRNRKWGLNSAIVSPKKEEPCALRGSYISQTHTKNKFINRYIVLLSPGIWCSGLHRWLKTKRPLSS